ncbi:MAG: hypothetical protein V1729_02105 [Candidatus Woesearchaeota archaeon]
MNEKNKELERLLESSRIARMVAGKFPLWRLPRFAGEAESFIKTYTPMDSDAGSFKKSPGLTQRYILGEDVAVEEVRGVISTYLQMRRDLGQVWGHLDRKFKDIMTGNQIKEHEFQSLVSREGNMKGAGSDYIHATRPPLSKDPFDVGEKGLRDAIRKEYAKFATDEFSVDDNLLYALVTGANDHVKNERFGYLPILFDEGLRAKYPEDCQLLAGVYKPWVEKTLPIIKGHRHDLVADVEIALDLLQKEYPEHSDSSTYQMDADDISTRLSEIYGALKSEECDGRTRPSVGAGLVSAGLKICNEYRERIQSDPEMKKMGTYIVNRLPEFYFGGPKTDAFTRRILSKTLAELDDDK